MLTPVLLLSRVTGRDVLGAGGHPVGRLADLSVRLDGDGGPERVQHLVVTRRNSDTLMLPWEEVDHLRNGQVVLSASDLIGFEIGSVSEALRADEILLVRDVLDTQVVDVVGQRLARVADVLLDPADSKLVVLGVEVGFGGVLRRLGLRGVSGTSEDVVAWSDLHLTSERGHAVELSAPRAAVHRLDARALAALVSRLHTEDAGEVLAVKEPAVAAEAVRAAHPVVGERVLRAMPRALADRIVAAMPGEHAGWWRTTLERRPRLGGRRFLRSTAWPHRRHLIRDRRG